MIKPILCVLTSENMKGDWGISTGFAMSELTHPLRVFENARLSYEFASIKGGQAPIDGFSFDLSDEDNRYFWQQDSFRQALRTTKRLADVNAKDYSAVFFVGGHGTMWDFRSGAGVNEIIRAIYEQGGIVSAVCHGPAALVDATLSDGAYLVKGKKLAAFTDLEEEAVGATDIVPYLLASTLIERGALHQAGENWSDNVVIDGRLITGQNPQSARSLGIALCDALNRASH